MWIVRLALRRPYTFVVMALLIAILGGLSIATMPVDIFPYIDLPVVSVVWQYNGLTPEEMESRIVTNFERADSPARVEQPDAQRAGNLRPGEQLHPHAARHRARRHRILSVRGQEPPD